MTTKNLFSEHNREMTPMKLHWLWEPAQDLHILNPDNIPTRKWEVVWNPSPSEEGIVIW